MSHLFQLYGLKRGPLEDPKAIAAALENMKTADTHGLIVQEEFRLRARAIWSRKIRRRGNGYIRPQIKLEFGARGETKPKEMRSVGPYAVETFPGQFEVSTWSISTLSAERTFWEKVTILHSLYHGSKLRDRMSRHYYDTYMLSQRGIAANALQNPLLLDQVVRNKSLLFRDASASYDTAKIGSLKLIPSEGQLSILERDYGKMTEMFMGEYPDFEMVMAGLAQLEARINNL